MSTTVAAGSTVGHDMDDSNNKVPPSPAVDEEEEEDIFTIKKWNAVALWSWNVQSENCAICRFQLINPCLRCQDSEAKECVVVWGECSHSFHNCCMSKWVEDNNRCPLCQQQWVIQVTGR